MNDPTEEERFLGDPPEPPDHVWDAALDHAFDPWAEPDSALVPTDDPAGSAYAVDDLAVTDDLTGTSDHDGPDQGHDPLDHDPLGHDHSDDPLGHTSYDEGTPEHGGPGYHYDAGFTETDGFF